jgi:acetoacetyl-CoA synthetase
VRIGPAEIYRALHGVAEVHEAMAVEQRSSGARGQSRLLLLVVLREGAELDGRLSVRIRREIARATSPLHVPEVVVAVDELPVTHSGKRSERAASDEINGVAVANADALANPGSLDGIRAAVAAELQRRQAVQDAGAQAADGTTEQRLRPIWESVLGIAPLHPDDNFFDLGGTSLAAVQLLVEIHERLGIELPLSTLLHAPTPAAMAGLIDGTDAERVPSLVLLRTGSDDRPVFLIHSLYGDVLSMRPLAMRLDVGRPVYGLQARGLNPDEEPQTSVDEMADSYIEIVRSAQPAGPYALGGHSYGGLVAFEMARRLERLGERVEWLGLIDTDLHHTCLPGPARVRWAARKAASVLRSMRSEGVRGLRHYARRAAQRLVTRRPLIPPPAELELPPRMRRLEEVGWEAFNAYCPSPYGGSATFFRAADRREDLGDPIPVWNRVVEGGLTVEALPGGHADMLGEPIVGVLAERMARHLAPPTG